MYIDLIILVILIIAVVFFFRSFSSFVYLIITLDILYRLFHFLSDNLKIAELTSLVEKYIPENMVDLISNYIGTSGIIYTILIWFMFAMYCVFLFYTIRILVKKKL